MLLRVGDSGPLVLGVRSRLVRLGLLPLAERRHLVFDASLRDAVRRFQQDRGLGVDGIVGPETFRALEAASWSLGSRVLSLVPSSLLHGDDVLALQVRLSGLGFDPGRCDGVLGPDTAAAVAEFRRNVGLDPVPVADAEVFSALRRLERSVTGGNAAALRERQRFLGPGLSGRVVALDAGHGGPDRGASCGGVDEASVALALADLVRRRLMDEGAFVVFTRLGDVAVSDVERVGVANRVEADLFVSFHVDESSSRSAEGVAAFFFGAALPGSHSDVGAELASCLVDEVTARTGMLPLGAYPMTWDLLRHTRMPAVRLEVGYVTSSHDRLVLGSSWGLDAVAAGVVAGLLALYPAGDDPWGVLPRGVSAGGAAPLLPDPRLVRAPLVTPGTAQPSGAAGLSPAPVR